MYIAESVIIFPDIDNTIFRIQWRAYDPRERMNLHLEDVTNNRILSLEIRQNEYVFYGYHHFSTDIVWYKCYDKTDVYPTETGFYGVWINDLDVKHIISANEWTFYLLIGIIILCPILNGQKRQTTI